MLPFKDALNNDDPLSEDLKLASLRVWYFALILIGSNFFGIPLFLYGHKHSYYFLAGATFIAVFFSVLYHTCQTTGVCFGLNLFILTLADHISAPTFMMMLILFVINSRSVKQIKRDLKSRANRQDIDLTVNENNISSNTTTTTAPSPTTIKSKSSSSYRSQIINNNIEYNYQSYNQPQRPRPPPPPQQQQQQKKHNNNNNNNNSYRKDIASYHSNVDRLLNPNYNSNIIPNYTKKNTIQSSGGGSGGYYNNNNNNNTKRKNNINQTYLSNTIQTLHAQIIPNNLSFKQQHQNKTYENETNLTQEEVDLIESRKTYYNTGYSQDEPNTESNAFGSYITITSIFIVIIAALAHPFSMQAFVIAIVYGFAAIFIKIVIIDEGIPVNMYHRISLPDLLLGIILISISLVFYVIDIYWEYAITHSLWHVLSFLGAYFFVVGLTYNVDNWYSPLRIFHKKTMKCCLNEEIDDDDDLEINDYDEEEDEEYQYYSGLFHL